AKTLFEPILALHNFDSARLDTTLAVGFRGVEGASEMQIRVLLAPGETKVLPLGARVKGLVPEDVHWASLEVQYSSKQNALEAALVSVTQDGRHSIRSVLNWVEGSASDGPFWQVDDSRNTLIGMYNADTEPAQVEVSLDYYAGDERHSHKLG